MSSGSEAKGAGLLESVELPGSGAAAGLTGRARVVPMGTCAHRTDKRRMGLASVIGLSAISAMAVLVVGIGLLRHAYAQGPTSPIQRQQVIFLEYKAAEKACLKDLPSGSGVARDTQTEAIMKALVCLKPFRQKLEQKLRLFRAATTDRDLLLDLSQRGFAVIGKTAVENFLGCNVWTAGFIWLEDGDGFKCDDDALSSGWEPPSPLPQRTAYVLKHAVSGATRLLVDGILFEGRLVRRY